MSEIYPRAPRWVRGYDPEQVERLVARSRRAWEERTGSVSSQHIRTAGFDLRFGGYRIDVVDASLDRVEEAFARRERDHPGTVSLARRSSLTSRLERPDGGRFPRASGLDPAYDPAAVDALCHRIAARLATLDSGTPAGRRDELTAADVRTAVFRARRGSRGYRETPVDAFLDRAVEVLLQAEPRGTKA